jgi:hypothetical protein
MKIVSYKQSISGIDIAIQRDILWPCHAFNITVPVQKERDLNIFEEIVLKMIDIETSETAKLVELLSLKVELIQFIKSRLVELDLIDERFNLTSDGINLLKKFDEEEEKYEIVTLFINLVSGKILPVVIQKLETIKDYELEGTRVNFKIGSSGNAKEIKANKITYISEYKSRKVSNDDVIKTVNTFRRLYNRFSSSLSSKVNLPRFARNMGSITINQSAEEVYLHCKVLIQKGNSDFLVTDPFGFDFSSQLTKDIQNDDNDKWLKELRSEVEAKNVENKKNENTNDEWANNIFAIDELNKYWNITRHLKNVEENYQKSKEKTKDLDNEQKIKNTQSRMVQSLYEVMESVFKQIENDYPSEMVYKEMFTSQSAKINQEILEKFAKKVGFNIPKYGSFLNLQPNMISALDKGIVRPEAMVALALSKAKEDENHPFHILAKNVPNFLLYIKKLQGYRNSVAHGSDLDIKIFKTVSYRCRSCSIELDAKIERKTCEECDSSLEKTTEFEKLKEIIYLSLESLYPAFFLKEKKVGGFTQKVELPNQEVLKAKKGLDKNFSLILIKNLKENQNLYEQLIKIEMAELNLEKYASVYINSIYSVLQILLDEHNSHIYKELKLETIRGVALKNANSANFKLPNKQWTDELVYVSKKMIKNASEGNPSSLGASLLVLLAFETSDKLGNVKLKVPNLIEIISLVLKLRGHGDSSSLEIIEEIGSKKQLIDLKKSIYKIIKTMKEL